MSQTNFMRNVRMTLPQYVTNITSFSDTVKILKNKGILSESLLDEEEEVFSQGAQDEYNKVGTDGYDNVSEEDKENEESDEDAEFDAILKQLEDQIAGEIAVKSDVLDKPLEEINENQEPKAVDENIEEVTTGIAIEHECYPTWDYAEVEKLVKKNIKKNPLYYTNYKLTGIRDYEVQTMDSSKPEDHQMKFYTEKTAVDKAREMKKVKMPKKEEKKKLKENQLNEGGEHTFIGRLNSAELKKIHEIIPDAEIDVEQDDDMERTTITSKFYNNKFIEQAVDTVINPSKPTMRPGVDIGKSFEKWKMRDLKEMVRKAMAEMFDGRDNLSDISDDTKD